MATDRVAVTPLAHRAKWAQQPTEHDAPAAAAPAPVQTQPIATPVRFVVALEGDPRALDRVLAYAEKHMKVRGVY